MSGDSNSNQLSDYLNSETVRDGFSTISSYQNRFSGYLTYVYLTLIMAFMVGVRMLTWGTFVTPQKVYLSGNDGWYHLRQSMYVTKHWPSIMPYDLLTGYPTGVDAGTFGTLFDQIVGTLALIVGLGDPTKYTVALVLALTTVAFAGLTVFPVYYITKELSNKSAGIFAAVLLALLPGLFFARGLFGNGDHQMAETLFLFISLAAYFLAFNIARENVFVLETLKRDTIRDALEEIKYALVAGLAITAYILVWPPGVIFYVALAVFFALYASLSAYNNKHLSEPTLLVGGISMLPAVLGLLVYYEGGFGAAGYTTLQLMAALGLGVGCFVLIGLQRFIDSRDITPHALPGTILASTIAFVGTLSVVVPEAYAGIVKNVNRTLLLRSGSETLTIAEAQQFVGAGNFFAPLYSQYGLLFFVGMLGFAIMSVLTVLQVRNSDDYSKPLLLLIFGLFTTLMAFTQVRFNYYLAPMVAIYAGYTIYQVFDLTNIRDTSLTNLQGYQIIVLIAVIGVCIPGLLYPVSGTAVAASSNIDSVGSYTAWEDTLEWTQTNTPDDGIEDYGAYQKTDNPYADQAPQAYGVISWWDYGHWITTTASRSPVSNPFQQHAETSAEYLLETNETQAENHVEDLNDDANVNVKYVYVDWQMVSTQSKFAAPVTWHPNLNVSDTITPIYMQQGSGVRTAMYMQEQRYYESLMVRLYKFHGSRATPKPIVVDWKNQQLQSQNGPVTVRMFDTSASSTTGIRKFSSMQQARQYVKNDSSAQIGGVGNAPPETVKALEHYRLVKTSQESVLNSRAYQLQLQQTARFSVNGSLTYGDFVSDPSKVKMFQNVEGAKIRGTGAPPNATVTIAIQLHNPAQNTNFTYTQVAQTDKNGNFTMTVPYSTTGYDNWGPKNGHGNVEVKAIDTAKIYTVQRTITTGEDGKLQMNQTYYATETHIPEGNVIGENEGPITITLEEKSLEEMRKLFNSSSGGNSNNN